MSAKIAGYEFAECARFQAGAVGSANEVGAHLELLRQQFRGELTPEDVLQDARNHNSPLHTYFEWDDSSAAEQFRLSQARKLIRSVVAVYVQEDQPARRTKAFVHISEGETSHYRDTAEALSTEKTREIVLKRAWREFQSWKARYKDLSELAAIFAIADTVERFFPVEDKAA